MIFNLACLKYIHGFLSLMRLLQDEGSLLFQIETGTGFNFYDRKNVFDEMMKIFSAAKNEIFIWMTGILL